MLGVIEKLRQQKFLENGYGIVYKKAVLEVLQKLIALGKRKKLVSVRSKKLVFKTNSHVWLQILFKFTKEE